MPMAAAGVVFALFYALKFSSGLVGGLVMENV
jgi:hypothetical protein